MAIVRFDPFRELSEMQDRMSRLFGGLYHRADQDLLTRGTWWPPVDVYENDRQEYVIKAELPDMTRDDIKIVVENNTLTISGEKRQDAEVNEDTCIRVERTYGTFSRSFVLPHTLDTGKITADYRNGVLTVRMPKREEARPKQISVKVSD